MADSEHPSPIADDPPTGPAGVNDLHPGDHLCIIYQSEDEHREVLTEYLRQGLRSNQRVLYIVDAHTARQVSDYLRDAGLDPQAAEQRGQLVLLTRDDAYTKGGAFDPEAMVALLQQETERAVADGYAALRVTGEMSWALRGLPGSERLIEYENLLNQFFPGSSALGLCQYDRRRFSPAMLLDVLRTHPIAVIGTQRFDNLYYVPPEELLGKGQANAELDRWVAELRKRKDIEGSLRAQRDFSNMLVQGAPVFFVAINPDRTTRMVNEAMLQALGYEADEVVGRDYMDTFVPPEDREALEGVFEELVGAGRPTRNINRVCGKNGRELLVEWHGRPVFRSDGNVDYFFGVGVDITERERATRQLTERMKELWCLYEISQLMAKDGATLDSVLQQIVDRLPLAFQFPERVGATLTLGNEEYRSRDHPPLGEVLRQTLQSGGEHVGKLEVTVGEQPGGQTFLPEESDLLEEIAQRIGHLLDRRRSRERLSHLNAVLRAIRDVNQLIVRESDEESLIYGACDCLTRSRGFPGAWIVLVDRQGEPLVWASSGMDGAMEQLMERWRRGRPPACAQAALKSSDVLTVEEPEGVHPDCPLAEVHRGSGALVVRLENEGAVYGVLNVAIPAQFLEDAEERHLLTEVAGDLGLAMRGIERDSLLRESEQRYRVLFEETVNPIFVMDAEGNYIDANEAGLGFLECTRELLKQMNVADTIPPWTDAQALLREHRELWESGGRRETEYYVNGRLKVLDLTISPGLWQGQQVIWGLGTDITQRRLTEKALADSEARYRGLFEESPVALLEVNFSEIKAEMEALRAEGITDLEGYFREHPEVPAQWIDQVRFLSVNKAALELIGAQAMDEVIAFARRQARGLGAEAFRHEFIQLFGGHLEVEHEGQASDLRGNTVDVVVRLVVAEGHEGSLDRVLFSIQDVSEQVEAREEIERSFTQVQRVFEGTVAALAGLSELRDPYTAGHQRRVAQLACALCEELGLDQERLEGIRVAALLHDIGKNSIPTEILNRPGKLSHLEFSMIQAHPQVGHDILKDIEFPWPVAQIVLQHHERLDGSGYPEGLEGDDILLEARILAVADVVEAMASHRPYRPALGQASGLEEIEASAGAQYDARVVEACRRLFDRGFQLEEQGAHGL